MAMIDLSYKNKEETASTEVVFNQEDVKTCGNYKYISTDYEGVKKVVSNQGGYLAFLDYGRKLKLDKKSGMKIYKQDKSVKHTKTEAEARKLRREAEYIREGKDINTHKAKKVLFKDVITDFKKSTTYDNFGDSYKDHYDNYMNHFIDFLGDMEPAKITAIDIENYYKFQLERGNLDSAKRNKDGTVSKKEGISVNTIAKHKTALKKIWKYMIKADIYGVKQNVIIESCIPKVDVTIGDITKPMSRVPFVARPLSLEELNYTINDALQYEFDRSTVLMIALTSIGGLRHGEVIALKLGKVLHNELMNPNEIILDYFKYDIDYYKKNSKLMSIEKQTVKERGKSITKLPKGCKIRIAAVPDILKTIIDYALEQREQIYDIVGRELTSDEQLYLPLVNIIQNREVNSEKLGRRWVEYQERRNKRMVAAGLKPIPEIRLHDLRHTHGSLCKISVPTWQISYNMGHKVKVDGMTANTTTKVYWHDNQPYRDDIIKFWNENIKIDWDKALHKKINDEGADVTVNGSGHLIVSKKAMEERKAQNKKFIFKEEELEKLFLGQKVD